MFNAIETSSSRIIVSYENGVWTHGLVSMRMRMPDAADENNGSEG